MGPVMYQGRCEPAVRLPTMGATTMVGTRMDRSTADVHGADN
jgi:hypothetical protein